MNNKAKFVLVGCGRIATVHVAGYKDREDAELYGVYDKKKSVAVAFANKHGINKVYDSYEELLDDKDVVGIELLVPHNLHAEMAITALKAKKHVAVQKPMAMNIEECDRMIAAAKENGVILKVSENFVHYPPYIKLKELIRNGEIGKVQGIRYKMNNSALNSINTPGVKLRARGVDSAKELPQTGWRVDPLSWVWRLNDTLSGGGPLIFDDGYHKFSLFYDLFGAVEKVNAWIDETTVVGGITQDCPAVVMWKYADKKLYGVWDITSSSEMYIESKYYTCDERMEITGSRGVLWLTRCTATLLPEVAPVIMYRDGKVTEFWVEANDWQDSFINSTHNFIDAVLHGAEPILSGECGREVLRFALAAIESSNKGETIYLDRYEDKAVPKKKGFLKLLFGK
ncbi:MAG: Gfo/Idh/MocA family oxidoreductase [Clostridia bacterium]|nr:Gfo/Idh/MocA family oxidoreductase [Clostridia bacterium]